MKRKDKIKISIIALVPIIMVLNIFLKKYPQIIEEYYSNTINKFIREELSITTGVFSFSLGEILVILFVSILIIFIVILFLSIKKNKVINWCLNIIVYLSFLYILFMILWGFNYERETFDKIANLKVQQYSVKDLYSLCDELINEANALRLKVDENSDGIMYLPRGYNDVFNRANNGYKQIGLIYPQLEGKYGKPKAIMFSKIFSYTGITGVYMPYTGEANININNTDLMLPCAVAHEMAHQRGFAREEEANYIAYLACINNDDVDFQYSGTALALISSMNKLAEYDLESYKKLVAKYSEKVKKDIKYQNEFWDKYKGNVEKVTNKVNDNYLKYNGEKSGVESYGEMVELLLAQYKAYEKK